MATGKASDFVIYQEEFHSGMTEALMQETEVFNTASGGCIVLRAEATKGDYEKEAFFKEITSLVTRRDTTSVASVSDTPMTQGEIVAVKLARKIGPIGQTLDAWRKIMSSPAEGSFVLGQQIGKAVAVDYVNSAIRALVAAISNVAALTNSATGGTITHAVLNSGIAKFGDAGQNIGCFVMHSKPYYDLVGQAVSDNVYQVGGVTIMAGTVATFGRPTIVVDSSPMLNTSASPDEYTTLGLVVGAAVVNESEGREIVNETVTGSENLINRVQGEHAFNLGLKGYTWDVTNGGANPNDTALGTGSNWDKVATDNKSTAGIVIVTQ